MPTQDIAHTSRRGTAAVLFCVGKHGIVVAPHPRTITYTYFPAPPEPIDCTPPSPGAEKVQISGFRNQVDAISLGDGGAGGGGGGGSHWWRNDLKRVRMI